MATDTKPSSLLPLAYRPDKVCKTPAPVREERENMSVRAPLLVAICLSALSTARAEQARTFQAGIDAEDNLSRRPAWASQLQVAPKRLVRRRTRRRRSSTSRVSRAFPISETSAPKWSAAATQPKRSRRFLAATGCASLARLGIHKLHQLLDRLLRSSRRANLIARGLSSTGAGQSQAGRGQCGFGCSSL